MRKRLKKFTNIVDPLPINLNNFAVSTENRKI